jgi:hypothetical protein
MGVDVLHLPDLDDRPVAVDQVGDPPRDLPARLALPDDAELGDQLARRVGDDVEAQLVLQPEDGVQLRRIDTRADDLGAGFAELLEEPVEALRFVRSPPGESGRIEEDHRRPRGPGVQSFDGEAVACAEHA